MKLINVLNQSISYRLALSALLPSPTLVAATPMGPLAHKNTDGSPDFPWNPADLEMQALT